MNRITILYSIVKELEEKFTKFEVKDAKINEDGSGDVFVNIEGNEKQYALHNGKIVFN
jgi:hypothetical protein